MKTTKKAQVEVSFNWIFVLIAGAVILFFFIRLISSEIDTSDKISQSKAISRMNAVLSALQQNPDVVNKNYNLNYEIQFDCTVEGHNYGIKSATQNLPYQIIFTPRTIGNSHLIYWVKKLQAPFPVSPVLYLTDEETKYIFLEGISTPQKERTKYYYDLLPDNMSKSMMSRVELIAKEDEGYRQYIIITTDENIIGDAFSFNSNSDMPQKIKYVLYIDEDQKELNFYELSNSLYALSQNPEQRLYFTEETILGAIITGDPSLYDCAMNKLLNQVRIATDINLDRIKSIHEHYEEDRCASSFAAPTQTFFEDLSDAADDAINNPEESYGDLHDNYENIELLNDKLAQTDCVTIY